ncbi:hypothetical protein HHI36_003052 [Cryptolaemus montrouzieri]|uniref:Uncharacterized protein n=1 Tax=Cryptolaemus montrouzieri TaxID=559131 RepID=A0ABD2PCL4_9CUCU
MMIGFAQKLSETFQRDVAELQACTFSDNNILIKKKVIIPIPGIVIGGKPCTFKTSISCDLGVSVDKIIDNSVLYRNQE